MKSIIAFALVLFLASASYGQSLITVYSFDGWLAITREISVGNASQCGSGAATGTCHDTGAASSGASIATPLTSMTLTLKNAGTADREDFLITESLSHVPDGAKISFDTAPYDSDGRSATWSIGDLRAGESKTISYSFAASLPEGLQERVLPPQFEAKPLGVVLSAPLSSKVGSRISLSLMTQSGQPVSNATIFVHFPDGTTEAFKTNQQGTASVIASKEGHYTYSVMGHRLIRLSSTEAKGAGEGALVPAAAASAADSSLVQSIIGFLPIIAAIFAVIFILVMAYSFLSSKREEEEAAGSQPEAAAAPASNGAGFVYTQKFSFAEDAKREERVREVTHDVLKSRKRQLSGAYDQPGGEQKDFGTGEKEGRLSMPEAQESTLSDDEMENGLEKLEAEARQDGEAAEEDAGEESLESTIAKLEEIRQRLRQRQPSDSSAPETPGSDWKGESGGQAAASKAKAKRPLAKKGKAPKLAKKKR